MKHIIYPSGESILHFQIGALSWFEYVRFKISVQLVTDKLVPTHSVKHQRKQSHCGIFSDVMAYSLSLHLLK